eukprot:6391242-Prorocentrum_lima.AAC.1
MKCYNCGEVGHRKADCKKPLVERVAKNVCRFWQKDTGCARGANCTFQHPKKAGACYVCGSTLHKADKCTRPKTKGAHEAPKTTPAAAASAAVKEVVTAGALRIVASRGEAETEVQEEW